MKRFTFLLLVVFVVTGLNSTVQAQFANTDNDAIAANAEVLASVDVVAGNDLDFGFVTPGTNKSVALTDATVGTFTVGGTNGASVLLDFTVPTDLSDGTNNLPIVFSTTDAAWSDDATYSAAADTEFDPTGAGATATLDAADGNISVFIGGQVQPTAGQVAGTYTANITLTATYN